MKKNENEKVTITVSSRPNDMRGWFEEKSGRILEELSFLADTLHRPGDAPAGGWPRSTRPSGRTWTPFSPFRRSRSSRGGMSLNSAAERITIYLHFKSRRYHHEEE